MKWFDDGSDRFRLMIWSIVDEWVDMLMLMNESIYVRWRMNRYVDDDWWRYCWSIDDDESVDEHVVDEHAVNDEWVDDVDDR